MCRARVAQQSHAVYLTVVTSGMQRRDPIFVGLVDGRTPLAQQRRAVYVACVAGDIQRCDPIAVGLVDGPALSRAQYM